MECPNDDPYFTRMMYRMKLLKKGMKDGEIVNVRRNTFYFICVVCNPKTHIAIDLLTELTTDNSVL